jgi:exopolysaccharide biosynthesis polyprenyl glycosylphosphotransferase
LSAESTPPASVDLPRLVPPPPALRIRERQLRRLLLLADISAGALAGTVAGLVFAADGAALGGLAASVAACWALAARFCGLNAGSGLRFWASGAGEGARLGVAALVLSWPVFVLLHAFGVDQAAAAAVVAAAVAAAVGGSARACARVWVHRAPGLRERTLVVGSGAVAQRIVEDMRRHPELGLEPVGYVDDDVHRSADLPVPYLGPLHSLRDLIGTASVDRVTIAFTRSRHEHLLACVRACRTARVPVDVVPRLFELMDGARAVDRIGALPLVSVEPAPLSRGAAAAKRALDLVGATLALVLLSPLLVAIAVAIRLDSRGPVLFKQERSGRGGRFFTLYKFRSMCGDAQVLVKPSGAIVKDVDDSRLTRVGRIIRRYSLDEAPQFLNVLKGDMSLVGPRPLVRAEQDALTEEWQAQRAQLRPGLTGLWQVSGRSHIPFEEMIGLDYQYAVGWSLARDIEILLATLPVVLSGRGAY